MQMNWKWTLAFAVALAGTAVLLDALAFAGKPAPPPPPPTPPIHYQINYFSVPVGGSSFGNIRAMNDSGVMVGEYYPAGGATTYPWGFIYDPGIDPLHALNLNDLVDLTGAVTQPNDWFISHGFSVNDKGAILVTIVTKAQPNSTKPGYEARGLLIDTRKLPNANGKWTATPISVPAAWNVPPSTTTPVICYGRDINNNGDLLGVFSDGTQSGAFIYNTGLYNTPPTLPTTPTVLPFAISFHSNGARLNDPSSGGKLQIVGRLGDLAGFRYTVGTGILERFPELLDSGVVSAINGYGEFCGRIRVPKLKGSQFVHRPFRFNPPAQMSLIGTENDQAMVIATDINDSSDVAIGRALFHNDTRTGVLNLSTLVVGSDSDVAYFLTAGFGASFLTERDETGFPGIGGLCAPTVGCLLVPVP